MQPAPSAPAPFTSVFDRAFDTVVFGAGFVGLSAARTLAARGIDTLLVESSGDLLWEATRALENTAAAPSSSFPEWDRWLGELRAREGANDRFFDPALAEILTAHELVGNPPRLRTLLYAAPVALETSPGGIAAVIVATKGGPRRLRARRWIDATEQGALARLARPDLAPRPPRTLHRSLVLQSLQAEKLDDAFPLLAQRHPGLEWFASVRSGERRLRWHTGDGADAWHRKAPALVADLRAVSGLPFLVSHCATADLPVYNAAPAPLPSGLPANLAIASPALSGEALVTPADRFALGARAASALPEPPAIPATASPAPASLPAPAVTLDAVDVLVAGAGTGGALAAIAAGRSGARTLALDATSYPGGVGTGGGICGYFHGAKGGLQTEIDERVRAANVVLTGAPATLGYLRGWHHAAKEIALLSLFDEAGVAFLGDSLLAGVERDGDGRVLAALVVAGGRLARLPAAAFVDGTGDGDLAAFAGAGFISGRPGDRRSLAYSQTVFSLEPKEDGPDLRACNFDAGWVDPNDPDDLSAARLRGLAQHLRPVWTGHDRAVAVAPLLGLRQSRHIDTDARVAFADLVEHRRFDDAVGEVDTVADTHSVDYEFETDELAFYYWACRGFRHTLRSELPYRMLLPRGLANVWMACRAAGVDVDAAYGLRMQREMQRLGEVAGIAAALATKAGTGSRAIDFPALRRALERSGALAADRLGNPVPPAQELLAALDGGLPGVHLWHLFRHPELHGEAVRARLASPEPRVSFYAAALLALWDDAAASPRLLAALEAREDGPLPAERPVNGAHGQCIDLPFWLQAVVYLRRVGDARCLPALRSLAGTPALPFNIRTIVALTLERLAARLGAGADITAALDALLADDIPDAFLPPSRSLWLALRGEPQRKLANSRGADTRQDHSWQLHLVVARTRKALGLPPRPEAAAFARDPRAFVRQAFAAVA